MTRIHPTAIVDRSAELHESVEVGPYSVIGPQVRIGEGTVLHNHVTIPTLTTLGRFNTIYPFTVIGADPQDRKFHGEHSVCVIGDHNNIREHVTVHRGTANGGGETRLGSDNLIMVGSHIAHDCWLGDDICIANQVMLAGHVHVEDGANIGGGAGVHHFATIGRCAFVGGLARITKDVPPFMIVEGNPAEVRAINSIAMIRRGYPPDHIEAVKHAYKLLFRENGNGNGNGMGIGGAGGPSGATTGGGGGGIGGGGPQATRIIELRDLYPDVPAVMMLCDALDASAIGVHGRARELLRSDNKRAVTVAS
jgi:UDP-N-acetylglucosamine acyltransferase